MVVVHNGDSPPLFQKFFLLCRCRAFQLGDLAVAFVLQRGAQALEKLGAGDGALDVPEGFAEIIGEGSVVSAADEGIGGCLVVFAAGEKNMGLGIVRSADLLKFQIVFIRLTAENINRRIRNRCLMAYSVGKQARAAASRVPVPEWQESSSTSR